MPIRLPMMLVPVLATTAIPAAAQTTSGAPWGARAPATCPSLTQAAPPSPAQAARLLRCARESGSQSTGELWLMEDVAVEVGGPTAFAALYNIVTMPGADATKRVHPIRGRWTWSVCKLRADAARYNGNPDLNCRETPVTDATGACWRTTFGDWKCAMNGRSGDTRSPTRPRGGA